MKQADCYSVVISNLQQFVQPDTIQNKLYQLDESTGLPKVTSSGSPYSRYAKPEDFQKENGIYKTPTYMLATPLQEYQSLCDPQKDVNNAIKTFCNRRPMAFFWHHGGAYSQCKFHGLHIHLVVQSQTPLTDTHHCRVLKKVCKKYGVDVRTQKVHHLEALLHHLQEEPRILLGCNNISLCARLAKTCKKNPFYTGIPVPDFEEDESAASGKQEDDAGKFIMAYYSLGNRQLCRQWNRSSLD